MTYDDQPELPGDAWQEGRTGFPIVDAGMRQLAATGWMHNRVRMITASFLCKDLHVWWPAGARHFLDRLVDGDVASNNHGWQWVAGTGTDASPYFRVFNPVTQGKKFDPDGDYVRRWVPELAHLAGPPGRTSPGRSTTATSTATPQPVVDHARGASRGAAPLRGGARAGAGEPLVILGACRSGGRWTTSRVTWGVRRSWSATSTASTSATST